MHHISPGELLGSQICRRIGTSKYSFGAFKRSRNGRIHVLTECMCLLIRYQWSSMSCFGWYQVNCTMVVWMWRYTLAGINCTMLVMIWCYYHRVNLLRWREIVVSGSVSPRLIDGSGALTRTSRPDSCTTLPSTTYGPNVPSRLDSTL